MNTIDFSRYQKIVIKVGSALIAPNSRACSAEYCLPIANFIKKCHAASKQIILVSSGAVAAGFNQLQLPADQTINLEQKQALAAIGQSIVIRHWQRFFDQDVAQVLLTSDDISNPKRASNAKKTFAQLEHYGAVPIVNENDTVVTEELKFGDNDILAAQVALLTEADLLIICSDVDGVFDDNPHANPGAQLIKTISYGCRQAINYAKTKHNPRSSGGMLSKLQSAFLANSHGIAVTICNGKKEAYNQLWINQNPGTWLYPGQAKVMNNEPSDKHTLSEA
ncbi:glutamate 5-kinase [Kangiella koreensis]|uniref:Glutamate 5-kinase n=1 Tax=Kangiella koreensis (strain DSM 16069 / JCM 12317 / KCTC 12182 / SW-125) TaxID=523791 RepID=C7RCB6_KANKD|nr:glutamate 5-kinase [Kangiella koreensis]ACV26908.1 glutamate 5-kinase [Kangiella koreensis DSM 16069]